MNRSSNGADFHLSDEILSVIPTDPYDQLDLARKITSMVIASCVSRLEFETGRLRQKIAEKDRTIYDLQEKLSQLERAFREADARFGAALDENMKLTSERDALALASKKLTRDLTKIVRSSLEKRAAAATNRRRRSIAAATAPSSPVLLHLRRRRQRCCRIGRNEEE